MKITLFNLVIAAFFITVLVACRAEDSISYITPTEINGAAYEMISPRFGDRWDVGTEQNIEWIPPAGLEYVGIHLYKKREFIGVIAESTENSGLYIWHVPDLPYRSHHYIIKIVDPYNDFTIMESPHFYVLK